MKTIKTSFIFIFSFILFQITGNSLQAQVKNDDILLKALQDEMDRNMTSLQLPGYDKPFFMMYGILDQKKYSISAILGSLTESSERPQRFKTNTRVLVGDYSFNDESLEDNLFSPPTAVEISLPIENDYAGIRRSFWSTTDKVYRDAARHFQRHQETLKESGKKLPDIPHRSFAKSDPVKLISNLNPYVFDKLSWETKAKNLSALYLRYPFIENSAVVIQYTEGYKYLINTEGTVARIPVSSTTFMALAQSKNAKGEFAMEQIIHLANSPDQLPSEQQLAGEIEKMIAKVESQSTISAFDEEYTGPVLLLGPPVAEVFSTVLFRSQESIMAHDNIAKLTGYQYDNDVISMDGKTGRSLFHESLTIKAKPKLKSYNGIDLLGSYEMDDEGIVPADEVVVIEKGILKNLLNNRTITHPGQTANGFSSGPGVIEVTVAQRNTEKELREKLIAKAKNEGLDYAVIVRDASSMGIGLMYVYKVSVADGKEELMRNAFFDQTGFKTLKRILGATENYQAHNLGGTNFMGGRDLFPGDQGNDIVSFIVPEALLLEEMEIRPFRMPFLKEEDFVSSPLKP